MPLLAIDSLGGTMGDNQPKQISTSREVVGSQSGQDTSPGAGQWVLGDQGEAILAGEAAAGGVVSAHAGEARAVPGQKEGAVWPCEVHGAQVALVAHWRPASVKGTAAAAMTPFGPGGGLRGDWS